ncbi:MAG: chromosome segregation protein SMC, partial [Clostridia bacterium]|nr:chromosome segregation protein SMC [Clostridia bacterium]
RQKRQEAEQAAQKGREAETAVRLKTAEREQGELRQTGLLRTAREQTAQREQLIKEQARCEATRQQIGDEHDSLIAALWDEYELTLSAAGELRTPLESRSAAERRIGEIKAEVKSLGHVNVGALEEYVEVKNQYEFYRAQVEDLDTAKAELEKIVADLTREMQSIFTEQFSLINENFNKSFQDLFGGGTATLTLADPANVLESGIEIRVKPPGKVINSLSVLSGGEQALTAIALYFGILRLRPSPFVILDEIDTALDEINVTRLASYYKRYTEQTQLILITHRRGSMEAADILYGVTMQERGVSKVLKIDANDVERHISGRAR